MQIDSMIPWNEIYLLTSNLVEFSVFSSLFIKHGKSRIYSLNPAPSTDGQSEAVIAKLNEWLCHNDPYVDPDSDYVGIEPIYGGAAENI